MFLSHAFVSIIYQPFLNVLIFFYWMVGILTNGHPDMGIAVILLTLVIRIILLPISLSEEQSAEERREMSKRLHEIEELFPGDPIRQREERKRIFHRNQGVVIGELVSFFIQVAISLMLWKMFDTGLKGEDVHLIYPFMPKVEAPFNLVFIGRFDLTHTNPWINLVQSLMIFLVETANILTSPYPPMKGEVVRLQLVLPVISFLVFMFLPAGKKIFVISTLVVSLFLTIFKYIRRRWKDYLAEQEEKRLAAQEPISPIVADPAGVDVK